MQVGTSETTGMMLYCMYGHTSPSVHMLGGARLLGWKYAVVGLA